MEAKKIVHVHFSLYYSCPLRGEKRKWLCSSDSAVSKCEVRSRSYVQAFVSEHAVDVQSITLCSRMGV